MPPLRTRLRALLSRHAFSSSAAATTKSQAPGADAGRWRVTPWDVVVAVLFCYYAWLLLRALVGESVVVRVGEGC